ncbi:cyclic nucleotide-gated cation channel beta-1-like, partial [Micropterus dolomieu]|uniref:cyclic nucleotide-gated cation channel beta-1-like n=1 Tax=Micropterus dolomieu TaxID=147949 RepID=UPI001E8E8B33
LQNLQEDSEDSTDNRSVQENKVTEDNKKNTVEKEPHKSLIDVCAAKDEASPSSTDVEPASERRDLESPVSQPITQQPEPQAPDATTSTADQAAAAAEEVEGGCGGSCGGGPGEAPVLRVEDVGQGQGLNIPQIITTTESEFSTLGVLPAKLSPAGDLSADEDDEELMRTGLKTLSGQGELLTADDETRPLSAASVGSVVIQDRLYELVKQFKGRTDRQKDRMADPDLSEEESPSACTSDFFAFFVDVIVLVGTQCTMGGDLRPCVPP